MGAVVDSDGSGRKRKSGKAEYTFEEYKRLVEGYTYDHLNMTPRTGEELSPLDKFYVLLVDPPGGAGLGSLDQVPKEEHQQFKLDCMPFITRTVSKDGVRDDYTIYKSGAQRRLIGKKVVARYDPSGYTDVMHVWDEESAAYIEFRPNYESLPKMTRKDRKRVVKTLNKLGVEPSMESIAEKYRELVEQEAVEATQRAPAELTSTEDDTPHPRHIRAYELEDDLGDEMPYISHRDG